MVELKKDTTMATDLILLHTADVHIATFNRLRDEIAPAARIEHIVRPDWLARARSGEGGR